MRVFLSWAGDRSLTAARAFHDLLSLVLQTIEVQMADTQLHPSPEWALEVRRMLTTADCAICFLTSDNMQNPWMLFEGGAWWASEVLVVPVLVDISAVDLVGPFAQFQSIGVSRDETFKLLMQLNRKSERPTPEATIRSAFQKAWSEIGNRLAVVSESQPHDDIPETSPFWRAQKAETEVLTLLRKIDAELQKLGKKTGA